MRDSSGSFEGSNSSQPLISNTLSKHSGSLKGFYRISHLNRVTIVIILFWQRLPGDELFSNFIYEYNSCSGWEGLQALVIHSMYMIYMSAHFQNSTNFVISFYCYFKTSQRKWTLVNWRHMDFCHWLIAKRLDSTYVWGDRESEIEEAIMSRASIFFMTLLCINCSVRAAAWSALCETVIIWYVELTVLKVLCSCCNILSKMLGQVRWPELFL